MSSLKLQTDSILQVPFGNYEKDFTFVVNGKDYTTNKIVADLLSTKISKLHLVDPTMSQIIINTRVNGDFQSFLDLINFKSQTISEQDLPFISEIFEALQPEKIKINLSAAKTTIDNIFEQLSQHENKKYLYMNTLQDDIDFLSSNLFQIQESQEELFETLQYDTIDRVFSNKNLQIESEDQLLRIVNRLYKKNSTFSPLYEYVDFVNVSIDMINEFASIYMIEDLSYGTWKKLLHRLNHEILVSSDESSSRAKIKKKNALKREEIAFKGNSLDGIFRKLKQTSNIGDEVNVTKSEDGGGGDLTLFDYDTNNGGPCTGNSGNEWICIELKNHHVIPMNYSVRTNHSGCNPKSWVIECSNDNKDWEIVDDQKNCSILNGQFVCHTFSISKEKQNVYKFIRLRLTDKNWRLDYFLYISSFEIFGYLI